MELYINKRTVHLALLVLLLLAASVTIVAAQQQQRLKQSAAVRDNATYPEPPMYGCLQMGEGNNKSCGSKLLKGELKVFLNGRDAAGKKIYYNQTLEARLTVTNVGDLPVKVKRLAVYGRPLNAKYKVDFVPDKQNFTVNPGDTVVLSGAKHKFNNPDPGGKWEIVSLMVDDNGQSVSDVQRVDVEVDTTCKALLRVPLSDAEIAALQKTCTQNKTGKEGGVACEDFCQIWPDKCGGTTQGGGQPGGQGQPADACGGCNPPISICYTAGAGATGGKPTCGGTGQNKPDEACTTSAMCESGNCQGGKCQR